MRRTLILMTCLVTFGTSSINAEEFEGVEFPLGVLSFADSVANYSPGTGTAAPFDEPSVSIGVPDFAPNGNDADGSVALGANGSLTLEFVDNRLFDQDEVEDGLDLFVYEAGPNVESFKLEISSDGVSYIDLGVVRGQPTGIDIKPFINPGDEFSFVRITDENGGGLFPFVGADIDAVGAIGAVVPEPSGALSLVIGLLLLGGQRRSRSC